MRKLVLVAALAAAALPLTAAPAAAHTASQLSCHTGTHRHVDSNGRAYTLRPTGTVTLRNGDVYRLFLKDYPWQWRDVRLSAYCERPPVPAPVQRQGGLFE